MRYKNKIYLTAVCSVLATYSFAATDNSFTGLLNQYPYEFYALLALNVLELVIIWVLAKALLHALGYRKAVSTPAEAKAPQVQTRSFVQRLIDPLMSKAGDEIDMKHDYDGISELDNKTPQWWSVAFYITILFGAVYLYRMFISETMPRQVTELNAEIEMGKKANIKQLSAANEDINENNVVKLDDDNVFKGSLIFSANCVPCHGAHGEGNVVGPNLTDDYWLHKGSIKDIFTTIKYGYPDKGMKSWQSDFSPLQIAQLSSYVKSLHGTNPPNGKVKQGDLYVDSTTVKADTLANLKPKM